MADAEQRLEQRLERLERNLQQQVYVDTPGQRILNGSLPFAAIAHPMFDQDEIFPDDAWAEFCDTIQDEMSMNPEHFSQNPYYVFITGGLMAPPTFWFSKLEAVRNAQADQSKTPNNQDEMTFLQRQGVSVRERIAMFPPGVVPVYATGVSDQKMRVEMYAIVVDEYRKIVDNIYKAIARLPGKVDKLCDDMSDETKRHEFVIDDTLDSYRTDRREILRALRRERREYVADFNHRREVLEDRLAEAIKQEPALSEEYDELKSQYKRHQEKIGRRDKRLKKIRKEMTRLGRLVKDAKTEATQAKHYGAQAKLRTQEADIQAEREELERERKQFQKQHRRAWRALDDHRDDQREYERKIEGFGTEARRTDGYKELQRTAANDFLKARRSLTKTINTEDERYERTRTRLERGTRKLVRASKKIIRSEANSLVSRFYTPDMPEFKEEFDAVLHTLDSLLHNMGQLPTIKGDNGYKRFGESLLQWRYNKMALMRNTGSVDETEAMREFLPVLRDINSYLAKQQEGIRQNFTIPAMYSSVTKRRIPLKLRDQLAEFSDQLVEGFFKEALSNNGERVPIVRMGYNNEMEIMGTDGEHIRVRFSGYGENSAKHTFATMRSSFLGKINRGVQRSQHVRHQHLADDPIFSSIDGTDSDDKTYRLTPSDQEVLLEEEANNSRVHIALTGPAPAFGNTVMGVDATSHTTHAISLASFVEVAKALYNDRVGTKTPEQLMAMRGWASGAGFYDYHADSHTIGRRTMSTVDLRKRARQRALGIREETTPWGFKLCPGHTWGDFHVGDFATDTPQIMAVDYLQQHDPFCYWQNINGDIKQGAAPFTRGRGKRVGGLPRADFQFAHFRALTEGGRQAIRERTPLVNCEWYGPGQHDISGDTSPLVSWTLSEMASSLESHDRSLFPTHLRQWELGNPTPLFDSPVQLLMRAYQGVGDMYFRTRENPDVVFAVAHFDHGGSYSNKFSKKFNPESSHANYFRRRGRVPSEWSFFVEGDRHALYDGMAAHGNVFRGSSFKSCEDKRADDFETKWGYLERRGFSRVGLPYDNANPMSSIIIPEELLAEIAELKIKPGMKKAYEDIPVEQHLDVAMR